MAQKRRKSFAPKKHELRSKKKDESLMTTYKLAKKGKIRRLQMMLIGHNLNRNYLKVAVEGAAEAGQEECIHELLRFKGAGHLGQNAVHAAASNGRIKLALRLSKEYLDDRIAASIGCMVGSKSFLRGVLAKTRKRDLSWNLLLSEADKFHKTGVIMVLIEEFNIPLQEAFDLCVYNRHAKHCILRKADQRIPYGLEYVLQSDDHYSAAHLLCKFGLRVGPFGPYTDPKRNDSKRLQIALEICVDKVTKAFEARFALDIAKRIVHMISFIYK